MDRTFRLCFCSASKPLSLPFQIQNSPLPNQKQKQTDTIMVFTPTQLHVLTSSKKAALLEPLKEAAKKSSAGVELVLHPRAKGDDGAAGVDALLAAASTALSTVKPEPGSPEPTLAVLAKEPPVGALGELWLSKLSASGAATSDAGPGLSRVLASKDALELRAVTGAALLAAACVTRSVAPTLEKVVDEEREVTHARLAARFDKALSDPTKLFGGDAAAAAAALPDPAAVDAAFTPCVQSGGSYDLKLGAAPDEGKLSPDVIVVSLGARASSYCAAVGRTYFVDPDATQEKEYKALCSAFDAAVGALKPGEPLSAAREAAVAALSGSEAPHLAKMLPKVIGGGCGLEVRESALALSSTSTLKVEPGMCFVVRLGVTGLTRDDPPKGKAASYALLVCDIVAVPLAAATEDEKKEGSDASASLPAEVLTASASRAWGDVAYELDGGSEDGEGGEQSEGLDDADVGGDNSEGGIAARKKALRAAAADTAGADRARAKQGQDALLERINQITLEALTSKGGGGKIRQRKSWFLSWSEFFFFILSFSTLSHAFASRPLLLHLSLKNRRLRRQDRPQALQRLRLQDSVGRAGASRSAGQCRRPRRVPAAAYLRLDAAAAHPDGQERDALAGRWVFFCLFFLEIGVFSFFFFVFSQKVKRGFERFRNKKLTPFFFSSFFSPKLFATPGDHAYVRITFGTGQGFEPCQRHPAAAAIKEVSFRAADARAAAKVVAEIKSLRAAVAAREKERAERATLVAQEKLIRASGGRPYTLPDVWVRPQPAGGKGRRVAGSLEAHANGFRYSSPRGESVDVMYRNIKHAFLQPAEGEMIALVHFHLHHPIMIGAKKAVDVQFFTEVMDVVQTLDAGSGRRNAYDPDEIEEEQREREMRARVNKTFAGFVKRVQHEIWEKDYG